MTAQLFNFKKLADEVNRSGKMKYSPDFARIVLYRVYCHKPSLCHPGHQPLMLPTSSVLQIAASPKLAVTMQNKQMLIDKPLGFAQ